MTATPAPLTPTGAARRATVLSDWRPSGRKGQAIAVRPFFSPGSPAALADAAAEACRATPRTLLALSALGNAPLAAAAAGLVLWVRDHGYSWGSVSYFAALGALSIALAVAAWLRAIATGAMGYAALAALSGRSASLAEAVSSGFRAGAALGLVCAVRLLLLVGGALACMLPAFAVFFSLGLAPIAVVAERLPVSQALVRSTRLAPYSLGGMLAALLTAVLGYPALFLQLLLALRVVEQVAGAALPLPGTLLSPEVALALLLVTKVVLDPLLSSLSAAAWIDARVRAEGLDLELRRQLLAGERLAVDPGRGRP